GIDEALAATGAPAGVDAELDGIRIQVHRNGDDVACFPLSLYDLTPPGPETLCFVRQVPASVFVLEGEALAVDDGGRPRPFQETSGRAARHTDGSLKPFFFDALHLDGSDLIDLPGRDRWTALDAVVPATMRVARTVVDAPEQARAVYTAALAAAQGGGG